MLCAMAPAAAAETLTVTVPAVADAQVSKGDPTKNYGSTSTMAAQAPGAVDSYAMFSVTGLDGAVVKATLRMYSKSNSSALASVSASDSSWSESAITWNNRPRAIAGTNRGLATAVKRNQWTEVDVTDLVQADGAYSFVVTSESGTTATWLTKENRKSRPHLVIVTETVAEPAPAEETTASEPVTDESTADASLLFSDSFDLADSLLTNEYAYWNPTLEAARTRNWDNYAGSTFIRSGHAWTGTPDDIVPDATSSKGNRSVIYRMVSKRDDFQDVKVGFDLMANSFTTSGETPAVSWDGAHIFLRYQSPYHLYYASVNRRDGVVMIKKKVPGGDSNSGTYHSLTPEVKNAWPVPMGTWQKVQAAAKNNPDGSVTIAVWVNGTRYAEATDSGTGGAPITNAGKVGIRMDNFNANWDNFQVHSY